MILLQTVRKAVQNAIGPGPSKRLRQFLDLESITLLHDFLTYEEKTAPDAAAALYRDDVPEDHWFSLLRRYVRVLVFLLLTSVSEAPLCRPLVTS